MAPKNKKVMALVKLQIKAAQATPAPPVGTALGQHGVNIMDFCKQYNDATQQWAGQVIPVELTIYEDRSFSFITKQPPGSRKAPTSPTATRWRSSRTRSSATSPSARWRT